MQNEIKVELIKYTPLTIAVLATRNAYASHGLSDSDLSVISDDIGNKDKELLKKVTIKFKHESVIEHISYSFFLYNIPRYVLQELCRHRIGVSLTVKSTRFTLNKDLKALENESIVPDPKKYLYLETVHPQLQKLVEHYIKDLFELGKKLGLKNDQLKKVLPENYITNIFMTFNMRSLRHFLKLRSSKEAHEDIRILANELYYAIPDKHKFLYDGFIDTSKD